jgi:hypothetical protein
LGFMFGNVDDSGDLDADYLDEVQTSNIWFWLFYFTCRLLADDMHLYLFLILVHSQLVMIWYRLTSLLVLFFLTFWSV